MKKISIVVIASMFLWQTSAYSAQKKVTDLTAQSEAVTGSDIVAGVDVSDTTDSAEGTSKQLTWSQVGSYFATLFQAKDADLDDLADGELTGSKVGTGINGDNITTGTVADARIASTITRDSEALVGDCTGLPCLDGTSDGGTLIKLYAGTGSYWTALQGGAPAANRSWRLPIAAAPSAGTTKWMNMDEYGQMGFVTPIVNLSQLNDDIGVLTSESQSASQVPTTTTNFNNNLSSADDTVQKALDTLDNMSGGGGYTNLTSFVGQTPWRLFYSNTDGDVTELALGADGEYLKSNGASLTPTWSTPSGAAHDAVTLGSPANGLSLATQQLSLGLASSSATGALSNTDWSAFNSKQAALTNPIVAAGAQSITGAKTFDPSMLLLKGSSTGVTTIANANSSATDYTQTIPAKTGTFAMTSDIVAPVATVRTTVGGGSTTAPPSEAATGDALDLKADKYNTSFNAASYDSLTVHGAEQTAGAFETGVVYEITAVGTTDFTAIGASANTIGVTFTSSGAGSGTGTAVPYRPIISATPDEKSKTAYTASATDTLLSGKQAYDANMITWPSAVSATETGYLDGVTSGIQGQLDAKQAKTGADYPGDATAITTGTGNINIDGVSKDLYWYNNGSSAATYTPVITSPPASGRFRGIILKVGGGSGVCTMTWTNVTWIGTAGAAATTANKVSRYGCFIYPTGNAFCKIIAEATDN